MSSAHNTPPCREPIPKPWLICHTIVGRAGDFRISAGHGGRVMSDARIRRTVPVGRRQRGGRRPGNCPRRCRVLIFTFGSLLGVAPGLARGQKAGPPHPEQARLREVVEVLASPEFGGRSGAAGAKTTDYLIDRFRRLKLEGLFQGGYTQTIPGKEPGTMIGRNVGRCSAAPTRSCRERMGDRGGPFRSPGRSSRQALPGRGRQCLGRRHDARGGPLRRAGADAPKRSIMFIGFDLEEVGLFGSRYFVAHPPVRSIGSCCSSRRT